MQWLHDLVCNDYFIWCAMAVVIFGITQLLKLPIKLGTKHIKNERLRKIVNATILLIPFGLGILFEFLYTQYCPLSFRTHEAFSLISGVGYGSAGISLYGVIERFFKVKVDNPYDTKEGEAVKDLVADITKDGKIDTDDKSAVQEFLDKVSK